jgi:transcription-repair coupling factor (superfamily II helicase)
MLDRLLPRSEQQRLLWQVRDVFPGGVLTSLHGSSASLIAALLHGDEPGQTLVVTATLDEAEAAAADLTTLLPQTAVLHFPEQEILPYDTKSPYKGIVGQQVEILHRLLGGEPCVVVTSAKGLKWKVLPPSEIRDYTLGFRNGDTLDPDELARRLAAMGYYAVPRCESPGDLARKGGILDIFSVSYENPLRIELFGDTIESIRFFDATTQRSLRETDSALVPPCSPLILSDDNVRRAQHAVRATRHGSPAERAKIEDHIGERLHFDGMERYAPFYSPRALVSDFLEPRAKIVWMRPHQIVEHLRRLDAELRQMFEDCVQSGVPVPEPDQVYAPNQDLVTLAELQPSLYLSDIHWTGSEPPLAAAREPGPWASGAPLHRHSADAPRAPVPDELLEDVGEWPEARRVPDAASSAPVADAAPDNEPQAVVPPAPGALPAPAATAPPRVARCEVHATTPYAGNVVELQRDLARRLLLGQRIHIFCDNEGQAQRLGEILDDVADRIDFPVGELRGGFILPTAGRAGIVVLTDHEIFHRYRKRQRRRKYRIAQGTSAYEDLQPGDFVVHVNYGIARYLGIKTIVVEGSEMDCLELLFADGDKIFVTVDQINLVEKYVGKEGVAPQLTKLGGTQWARATAKARAAVEEMAQDLLHMAAIRSSRRGIAFTADTHLLKEMEATFVYDETPDQQVAIDDVKRDMEKPVPMDRLVCGDVGYGKTEVAMRAAFKAVLDGKQVAVLVPTTILAQQHLNTFRERLAGFPVQVEMLSRVRSPKESKAILEQLARGGIDIVIGTHRLLSKDVKFKALGLIVIDEEHRFGVGHKEKLKHLKETVDALSLTATPIPRTLNMALIGLRDMSLIETAPRDRLPVQTEILPFDEETITDAILREMDRGGQVYFVHNRIESIDAMAGYVRRMAPQARVAIGHGQMDEHQLERVMLGFLDRDYDILVSTMIIESGLDIPNVNTLIVNRADRLGLAQLYQLRGRVGRSSHKAYAYFMVPRGGQATELARKRLSVLQEFEALGSGFKIAMRDLEIRGAGNILGQQQHGHLVAIGFELYCRLLEQAVAELKGEELPEEVSTKLEVDADYLVPEDYVPDPEEKMLVYKKIAAMSDAAEVEALRAELVDRYGPPPPAAEMLLEVAATRIRAWQAGVARLRVRGPKAEVWLRPGLQLGRADIEALVRASPNKLGFDAAGEFKILVHFKGGSDGGVASGSHRLRQVAALLAPLAAIADAKGQAPARPQPARAAGQE